MIYGITGGVFMMAWHVGTHNLIHRFIKPAWQGKFSAASFALGMGFVCAFAIYMESV